MGMEQAVFVTMKLQGGYAGSIEEQKQMEELCHALASRLRERGAGELASNEMAAGEATIYLYGQSADQIFETIEPLLRASPLMKSGSTVRKRHGMSGEPDVRQETVEF
jgi:hypothetical protein